MRTAQQLFDIVVHHLRQQNARCMNENGTCFYRNDQGMKCAVGALIPDDMYSLKMENNTLPDLLSNRLLPSSLEQEFELHQKLLYCLQNIHDGIATDTWEDAFWRIAQDFQLTLPPKP